MTPFRSLLQLTSVQHPAISVRTMAALAPNTCQNPALGFKSKHLEVGSVQPKTDPKQVTFYNMRFCPYAQRSALVLMAKGIPFENINIHLRKKPDWFLAKNTISGKVPIVEYKGVTVRESNIINEYLDEAFPEKRLMSTCPVRRARDKEMVEISKKIYGSLHGTIRADTDEKKMELLVSLNRGLSDFEEELKKRGTKFFGGDAEPGMLDYTVWPWFERYESFPIKEDLQGKYPVLNAYVNRMFQVPVIKAYALSREDHLTFFAGFVSPEGSNYDLIYQRTQKKAKL